MVTATVDLDDIKQFYRAVDLGAGSAIQLVREDGTLFARNPPALEVVDASFLCSRRLGIPPRVRWKPPSTARATSSRSRPFAILC